MRTLLIDNHDSFTYNLFQYLAACNGEAPVVVRNDEMNWHEVEQLSFDNIVISPGPGCPQRPADLGISADALQHAKVPILGVCLGHQAIAHACGATVDLAVRPMHGRLDRISHGQRDLFRGIPDRFEAVRYHSLAVTKLPGSLEPLAWTSDGTLMALRHVRRPWWGVQFHPESICTEFGARLLRNFRELTEEWCALPPRKDTMGSFLTPIPAQSPPKTARPADHSLRQVHVACIDTPAEAEAVFSVAFGSAPAAFWLDSSLPDSTRARFSFMGDAGGPHAQVLRYRSNPRELQVQRRGGTDESTRSVFDHLEEQLSLPRPSAPDLPFDFTGGFVGYFGYGLKGELSGETDPAHDTPDAAWILADRFIAFDHADRMAWIVCVDGAALGTENREWMQRMKALLSNPPDAPPFAGAAARALGPLAWRTALPAYRERILRAQEQILQGETYEVCLTNQLEAIGRIDALGVYRALRAHNPSPYAAFLQWSDVAVLSASPELFLRVASDRTVDAKPIKGTASRGATPEEDAAIAAALMADEKTRAENLMIVDLLRNDLNRVCEIDSVHVPDLFRIESYATVHQLVSTIRGRVRPDRSLVDVVRATFPGGSMTGAPKERTMRILDGLEGGPRGVYAGSLGYLSLGGTAQLNIVIRSIVTAGDRLSIGTGGAIVAMSDPDDEVDETVLKTRALVEVLAQCGAPAGDVLTTVGATRRRVPGG